MIDLLFLLTFRIKDEFIIIIIVSQCQINRSSDWIAMIMRSNLKLWHYQAVPFSVNNYTYWLDTALCCLCLQLLYFIKSLSVTIISPWIGECQLYFAHWFFVPMVTRELYLPIQIVPFYSGVSYLVIPWYDTYKFESTRQIVCYDVHSSVLDWLA